MPPRRLSTGVLAAALSLLFWVFLAPPALGGQTSYVVTRGVSMQPAFHTGDLALVRRRDEGFRTQGDNNAWIDPDVVSAGQVIGELWVHLPGVGANLRAGLVVPLAALLAVAAVALPLRSRGHRRRSRGKGPPCAAPRGVPPRPHG